MNVKIGSLFRPSGSRYISHVYETHLEHRKHRGLIEVDVVLYYSESQATLEEALALCRRWCQANEHEFTISDEIERMPEPSLTHAGVLTMRGRRSDHLKEAKL